MATDQLSVAERPGTVALWQPPSETDEARLASQFTQASPFPHLVIDGLFDPAFLTAITDEIKRLPSADWSPHYTALQKKRMTGKPADLPFSAARYFSLVNAPEFIAFLEAVTGIPSLRPDLTLLGGGVHEAGANGHFEIHVDFQKHPSTGLQNRLAVITYLNTDWTEADGGALELWNMKDNRSGATIPPLLGRTVIMGQSPVAAHGYPEPLPGSRPRRALIAYFYSQPDKPAGAMISTTRYIRRPGMPLSSHLQMTLRDIFPQPIVRSLRQIRSRFTHKRSR